MTVATRLSRLASCAEGRGLLPREIDGEPTQPKHPGHPASGTLRIAAEMPVSIVYGDGGAPKTR